jgi:hypothetical protein
MLMFTDFFANNVTPRCLCDRFEKETLTHPPMKRYQITFHDGTVQYVTAERDETHVGRTLFYREDKLVKILSLDEVAMLDEMEGVHDRYRELEDYHDHPEWAHS